MGLLGVAWQDGSLEQTLARAKAADKWVLVDVYATWCGPCHEMDDKVYVRDDVARAVDAGYLALRRDGERGEGEAIHKKYHVVGFPTLLVLDASGAEVDRVMGFVPPKELMATLGQFRAGRGTIGELERRLAASPKDDALKLEVGTRHAMRGDARAVAELTQVAASGDAKLGAPALLTLGKYYWLRGQKNHAKAEATLRDLIKRFPASEEAGQAPYHIALAMKGLGRDKEIQPMMDDWIKGPQKDASRHNSYAWLCFKENWQQARGVEVARAGLAIDPKNDGLWDTLAELQFALGRADEARAAAGRALALKPGDAYYTAQLRRFGGAP